MQARPECVWEAEATLGEGPMWSEREQALYWVDILGKRLLRYTPATNERRTWQFDEEISSVVERENAPGLAVTLRYGFALFDPHSGALEYVADVERGLPNNRFNDGKCDSAGRYWAGSVEFGCEKPVGAVYRLLPDRRCERMDDGYAVTNGPAWSADGRTMYYNDSHLGRVHAYDFDPEAGTIANRRVFLQFAPEDGSPDGMTTDSEGGLWIAHWGPGRLTRHDPDGRVVQTIELPCSHVTSCAFGGPDFRTLYITSARVGLEPQRLRDEPLAGGLFAVPLDVPGMPAHRYRG